jgi:hypothetical protein
LFEGEAITLSLSLSLNWQLLLFFFERKVGILLIGIGNIYIQEDRRVPQPDTTDRF